MSVIDICRHLAVWSFALVAASLPPHVWSDQPQSGITESSYKQLKIGMRLVEAERIIGFLPVDMAKTAIENSEQNTIKEMREEGDWRPNPHDNEPSRRCIWRKGNTALMVRVDAHLRITDKLHVVLQLKK